MSDIEKILAQCSEDCHELLLEIEKLYQCGIDLYNGYSKLKEELEAERKKHE